MGCATRTTWLLLLACVCPSAHAAVCPVPSAAHPTLGHAVDDGACSVVALSAATFAESLRLVRSVDLTGAGSEASVIEGRIEIGGLVQVGLAGLSIANGCPEPGLRILDGAVVSAADVDVRSALVPCPALPDVLFRDGFE